MSTPWQHIISSQPRIAGFLERLAQAPPNSLLLEGGNASERLAFGLFWAARLMCREADPPCGKCRICLQIADDACRDLFLLNGAEGSINVDTVREVRAVLGDPPAGRGPRVVILAEAQALGDGAANALLKSLEEPSPGNVFVLLAPSREILLPTLVSRSFVLTLGWPKGGLEDPDLGERLRALCEFIQSGKGAWLEWTGRKGNVDARMADFILREVQRSLVQAGYGNPLTELARLLAARLDVVAVRQVGVIIENALESLEVGANPAVVLEWVAIRMWNLLHK
ncbi:MAG: DNA polymerase III subunit delta' [Desulfomicrobium apsheronum]|nr:DNA polymerase III subunit delta' [Desulfomicrobium apsheronum]